MAKYKVTITGVNTSNLKVLKMEEQTRLFKLMQQGSKEAKEMLIEGNLKLVLSIIQKFKNQNYNLDDLFQVGVIGLIKAIDNFDLSYNLKLSTYATPLIIGEIKKFTRENTSSIRVSRGTKEFAYQILNFKEEYMSKYGIEPSINYLEKHFNASSYQIRQALMSLKEPVSIFEPIYNDGGEAIYLADKLSDDTNLNNNKDELLLLKKALYKLKEREKNILMERFFVGKTQMELAKALNISQAQVSRIEKSALKNMRKLMK